jgi:hypothetical protein
MNVMAGRTAQRIKIYALFLESRVIPEITPVATGAGSGLCFFVAHRVRPLYTFVVYGSKIQSTFIVPSGRIHNSFHCSKIHHSDSLFMLSA